MAGAAPALPSVKETAALMAAIDARSLESVRREMQRGADPNAVDASGETALMHAAQCACDVRSLPVSVPIVQLLLDHHAAVNARDKDGKTALFYAIEGGSVPVTRLLLGHGADPNAKSRLGETPLHVSRLLGSRAMTELLLAVGAKSAP